MLPRLITIPLSHYCERARWALDAAGVEYIEDQNLQVFAGKKSRRVGATRTVPVLLVGDEVLPDSADIVRWASRQKGEFLYPDDVERADIETLEAQFAADYGIETRRVVYSWFFRNLETCIPYNECAAPRYQAWLMRLMKGRIVPKMVKRLRLTDEVVEAGRDLIRRTLDDVGKRIADGRPFLMGDGFTAADLTWAALTAPSVLPHNYGVALPRPDQLDEEASRWVEEVRAHPAGQFAIRLYELRPTARGTTDRPPVPIPA